MRFSDSSKTQVREIAARGREAEGGRNFVATIAEETRAEERSCGILLVGGSGCLDRTVRTGQSGLRYDRQSSYWSHAALVLEWPDGAKPDRVLGLECALAPTDPERQVPSRNGVTPFRLERYLDRARYPHLAFATVVLGEAELPPGGGQRRGAPKPRKGVRVAREGLEKRKEAILFAAVRPNRERVRFALWDWLGAWNKWAHAPHAEPSPLASGIPHPGAAFCEYAFEAARLDLSPGASAPQTSPELLWSTLRYWSHRIGTGEGHAVAVRAWTSIDLEERIAVENLPPLSEELAGMRRR